MPAPLPVLVSRAGRLDDAEVLELRENTGGGPPPEATRVRTAWDEQQWHIRFEVAAAKPWATMTQRDARLWLEEVVEVFIDPVGDGLGYFEIAINPLGTVTDLVLRRTRSGIQKDFTWDVEGLTSKVERTASGWTAELGVPFAALGAAVADPKAGQEWRVNFLRIARPLGPGEARDLSAWSPTFLPLFHRTERFGSVRFSA